MGRPAREKNEITALMATRLNMLNEERKRALEKEKGRRVSSTEIAKKLEIPQSSYSEYLRDMQTPSLETIKKLANYFHVTVDYLLGSSNVRNPDQYFQTLDKTKLSDKAIQTLLDNPEVLPFINSFIERTDLIREMAIRYDELNRKLSDYRQFEESYEQSVSKVANDPLIAGDPDEIEAFKIILEGDRRNHIKNFEIEDYRLRKCFEQFTNDVINRATKPPEDG